MSKQTQKSTNALTNHVHGARHGQVKAVERRFVFDDCIVSLDCVTREVNSIGRRSGKVQVLAYHSL